MVDEGERPSNEPIGGVHEGDWLSKGYWIVEARRYGEVSDFKGSVDDELIGILERKSDIYLLPVDYRRGDSAVELAMPKATSLSGVVKESGTSNVETMADVGAVGFDDFHDIMDVVSVGLDEIHEEGLVFGEVGSGRVFLVGKQFKLGVMGGAAELTEQSLRTEAGEFAGLCAELLVGRVMENAYRYKSLDDSPFSIRLIKRLRALINNQRPKQGKTKKVDWLKTVEAVYGHEVGDLFTKFLDGTGSEDDGFFHKSKRGFSNFAQELVGRVDNWLALQEKSGDDV